jgi:hypothetical protein
MDPADPYEQVSDLLRKFVEGSQFRLVYFRNKKQWQVTREDPFRLVTLLLDGSNIAADCDGKRSSGFSTDPEGFARLEGFIRRRFV